MPVTAVFINDVWCWQKQQDEFCAKASVQIRFNASQPAEQHFTVQVNNDPNHTSEVTPDFSTQTSWGTSCDGQVSHLNPSEQHFIAGGKPEGKTPLEQAGPWGASPGKKASIWSHLWVADFRRFLTANDLHPSIQNDSLIYYS